MALSAGGVGSGLDVNGIVSQLMALERRPLLALNTQKSDLEAKLSAFGQLKSALSTFQNAMAGLSSTEKFQVFSATSSNTDTFTTSADETASAASHSITVTQLARAHKLNSSNTSYATADTSIGVTGTLTIGQGSDPTSRSFSVTIDSSNNTLDGIKDAINNASDNTGVTASIVNDGTSARLVLTSETGLENEISIEPDTLGGGTGVGTGTIADALGFVTPAGYSPQDAALTIDGISVTSSSNKISDAIQGVTLNLKDDSGVAETLTIARDEGKVKEAVQSFVTAYNDLRKTLRTLGGEDATLQGDTGLLSIERSLQGIFNQANSASSFGYLSEIGITTGSDGSLSLDASTLEEVMASDFEGLASLMADESEGFAVRFEAIAEELIASDGLIEARKTGINSRISWVEDREQNLEYRLELIEQRYLKQFSALDSLMAQMNSTSSYLSQQLSQLPSPNSI